jgi:hypothetical protein
VAKERSIRLGAVHRRWLLGAFALLWISGVLWLVFHFFVQTEGPFGPRPHALENWWLRLHGLAAFAVLVAVGTLLPLHARAGLGLKRNLASGMATLTALAWLAVTGYLLYYFADPEARPWLPWLHWGAGLAVPGLLLVHVRRWRAGLGFRSERRRSLARGPANCHDERWSRGRFDITNQRRANS